MSKDFKCSVLTPDGTVYDGSAEFVVIPASDGELGILYNRAPLLCKLGAGRLRIVTDAKEQLWFVDGGFAQVLDNHTVVLTQRALPPEKIDPAKARAQLEEARQVQATDDIAMKRKETAEASARAQLRMAR